jgi:hypothetical protein
MAPNEIQGRVLHIDHQVVQRPLRVVTWLNKVYGTQD